MLLIIVDHKNKIKFLIPFNIESIIVHLVMLYDVLVYETKFTVGKSKEVVFKCISL